mgnify:CR=1 FL=1
MLFAVIYIFAEKYFYKKFSIIFFRKFFKSCNNIYSNKFDDLCDVITVTGAGEPTLNSELDNIITGIKEITNKPCAILTNTTTIHINEVFMSLLKFDIVVPSLDAVIGNILYLCLMTCLVFLMVLDQINILIHSYITLKSKNLL